MSVSTDSYQTQIQKHVKLLNINFETTESKAFSKSKHKRSPDIFPLFK